MREPLTLFFAVVFSCGVGLFTGHYGASRINADKIEELQNRLEIAETSAKECDFLVMQTERVLHKLAEECR